MQARGIALTLGSVAALAVHAQDGAVSRTPNIVFIFADDMGYGDVSALNPQSKIHTPNIDRLAADGVVFTDAHASSSVSTPGAPQPNDGPAVWPQLERLCAGPAADD